MTICRPILCLPWCSTSKVHLRSIFVTTEGRGLFTSALFWRIFGQIGPYCTTLPSVTPSTLPPKQNMHGGCPKSHALCPIFELDALVGTSMLLLNWQAEFGRDKRCSGSSKSTQFPKSASARFGCKQRKACNNTGVGYGGAVSTRSGGTPVRTVRAELACLSLSAARSGALLLKGPSSTEHWFPGSNLRSSKHPKL